MFNSKGIYIAIIQFNKRTGDIKILNIKLDLIIDEVARTEATVSINVNLINSLNN